MDQSHDALITEFCSITGADAATARSALESTSWNLNEAVTFFFAASDQPAEQDEQDDQDDIMADDEPQRTQRAAPQTSGSGSSRPPQGSSRLRTLRDLQRAPESSDDEEEENPDLFAGGEKSGLAVQDPNRPSDHFNNIIQQAQQNRPRPGGDDEPARPTFFSGRGQTLGGDDTPSTVVEDPQAAAASQAQNLPRVSRTLHLWQDGFSIDDGELYRFDDPANAHTLALINQGRAPLALLGVQPGQEVDLQLNPHRDEKFVQPKKKYKPFSGGGQRLGSPTPGASSTTATTSSAPAPVASTSSSASAAAPSVDVDESQPVLRLQIRLGDGSRLQSNFNTSHTIADVHNYINAANPASTSRGYTLMTTFPSKELSDKTVALGDLPDFKRGGVIVQKWT